MYQIAAYQIQLCWRRHRVWALRFPSFTMSASSSSARATVATSAAASAAASATDLHASLSSSSLASLPPRHSALSASHDHYGSPPRSAHAPYQSHHSAHSLPTSARTVLPTHSPPASRSRRDAAASTIARAWRRFMDRAVFAYYRDLLRKRERGDASLLLRALSPQEAFLADPAAGLHVRFRLGGLSVRAAEHTHIHTHSLTNQS
jgi:hypothetical protein